MAVDSVEITAPAQSGGQGIEVFSDSADKNKLIVAVPLGAAKGDYKFTVRPNGVAAKNAPTLTVSVVTTAMSATVKAEKGGKIDLMDRGNTKISYAPSIKYNTLPVTGVRLVPKTGAGKDGSALFDAGLTGSGKVELTAKKDAVITKGAVYKFRIEFTLGGFATVTTNDVAVKPAQSKISIKPKAAPVFLSRVDKANSVFIDLTPPKPAGAKIAAIEFKQETAKNLKAGKIVNNPNNAYWYEFTEENGKQGVRVWLRDGALAKPGKAALTFSVTYEGQGAEANGALKPFDVKVPLTVIR